MSKFEHEKQRGKRVAKKVSVSEKNLVTKANELVEARYRLSLREQKLILTVISMIEPDDDTSTFYNIPSIELIKYLGLENEHDRYKRLRLLIRGLQRKIVTVVKPNGNELDAVWLASTEYKIGSGMTEIEISAKLKPYLLQLKEQFTSYRLAIVLRLQSVYAIRLYELLKQHETFRSRKISVQELRTYFRTGDGKYKLYGHFKDRVLKPAVREINEKTDILTTFEEIKRGRKVVELRFTIKAKKATDDLFPAPLDESIPSIVKELMTVLSKRDAMKIWEAQWSYLDKEVRGQVAPLITDGLAFDQYLREKLQLLRISQKKQKIDEPKAWLKRAIKENWIDAQQERSRTRSKRRAEFQKRTQEADVRRHQEDDEIRNKQARDIQIDAQYITLSPSQQERINRTVFDRLLAMDDFKAQRVEIERVDDEISSGEGFFQNLPAGVGITAQRIRREIMANNE